MNSIPPNLSWIIAVAVVVMLYALVEHVVWEMI